MPRVLGIDLGGTNVKAVVVESGRPPRVLHEDETKTHARLGADAVFEVIELQARAANEVAGPVSAAGLAAPGPLDIEHRRTVRMPNLPGWEDVPIVSELEARLKLPVALLNDGRALALAEHAAGAGRGVDTMVCFALGTGVGGGVVVGGRLLLGMNGTIGELGHLTIERDGLPCTCGSRGCLEQYVSGPAIARAAGSPTAEDAVVAARAGDRAAAAALEAAGIALGIGAANVALAVGPERIVVGGGVAGTGDHLLDPARAELVRRVRLMPVDRISIVPAELGAHAGALGAALWAFRQFG